MTRALNIHVHIDEYPKPEECCKSCGADSNHYVKHPVLHGGRCTSCGDIWMPGLRFSRPEVLEVDLRVERTADGGATIYLENERRADG